MTNQPDRRVRANAYALSLVLAGFAVPARAADSSTAVVVTVTNPEDDATAVAIERIAAGLLAESGTPVVALEELLGSARTAYKELRLAQRQAQRGRRAFERANVDRARRHFRSALQTFKRHPAHLEDLELVVETLHQLGACARLVGRRTEWREAIETAVSLDPTRKPDPTFFNPDLRAEFDAIAAEVGARPTDKLTVTATPADARVFVDGRLVGRGSVTVELIHGDHLVRVVRAGHGSWGKLLRVDAEASLQPRIEPVELWQALQGLLEANEPPAAPADSALDRVLGFVIGARPSSCTVGVQVRLMTLDGALLARGQGELPLDDGLLTAALGELVASVSSGAGGLAVAAGDARPCPDELARAAAAAAAAEVDLLAQPDPEPHALDWALVGGGATAALLGSSILLSQELLLHSAEADRDAKDRAVRVGRTGFGVATAGLVSVGVGVALLLWL